MSRRTPEAAMLEDIHARVKRSSKDAPYMDNIERSMTLVRSGFQWGDPTLADKYMAEHEMMLRHIRRVFRPLLGRSLTISSQIGLWDGKEWMGYMADWGPHGVTGRFLGVEGVVINDSYSRIERSRNFQYCLVMTGPELVVSPDEPGIDLTQYKLSMGVLVPVRGLGDGWWQKINRIVDETTAIE